MMWEKEHNLKVPIKSWCRHVEEDALLQAENLANHPVVFKHVALMPDCHVGYGMPIGGVIACIDAVIPNAVGVDIGCGMGAVKTDCSVERLNDKKTLRSIIDELKDKIPIGEGHSHKTGKSWNGFKNYLKNIGLDESIIDFNDNKLPGWLDEHGWNLDAKNLGTLGGGNHFIEIQAGDDGFIWLMLHSGSRNLGHRVASFYYKLSCRINKEKKINLPDQHLAFLSTESKEGKSYIRDMNFALSYAKENRRIMMSVFKETISDYINDIKFLDEINIHHNYAGLEKHFGKNVWVHRKGATSAKKDELGIIPGSMGTSSYIVKGLGSEESFMSCSHGAGRKMGRMDACRKLTIEECNKAMGDVVYDRWHTMKGKGKKYNKMNDLSEAPLAYKKIDEVINSELDLIEPLVKLKPLAVLKG